MLLRTNSKLNGNRTNYFFFSQKNYDGTNFSNDKDRQTASAVDTVYSLFHTQNFHHIRLQCNSSDNFLLGHLFLIGPCQPQPLYLPCQSTKLKHDQWDLQGNLSESIRGKDDKGEIFLSTSRCSELKHTSSPEAILKP